MTVGRRIALVLAWVAGLTVGLAGASSPASASAGLSWSTPTNPDPYRGYPLSISCVSSMWCLAVDDSGQAVKFSAGAWHSPVRVEGPYPHGGLSQVSCAATTSCEATDSDGRLLHYDGHSWSAPFSLGTGRTVYAISCPTTTFCMAIGSVIARMRGTQWTVLPDKLPSRDFTSLSCSSAGFCMTTYYTNAAGNVSREYIGGAWGKVMPVYHHSGNGIRALSCTSHTFCMASGDQSETARWNGTAWVVRSISDYNGFGNFVSCTAPSYCLEVGSGTEGGGRSATWDGHGWSAEQTFLSRQQLTAVSCAPGSRTCIAMTETGQVARHTTRWGTAATPDPSWGSMADVSCGAPARCVVVDGSGAVVRTSGVAWTPPVRIDDAANFSNGGLIAVSCPTGTFCLAVDPAGTARRFDSHWGSAGTSRVHPQDVSCVSATWCAALDDGGHVSIYDGSTWSAPVGGFSEGDVGRVWHLSCTYSRFCAAADNEGGVRTFNGRTWSARKVLTANGGDGAISCVTSSFCVASVSEFATYRYDGTTWKKSSFPAQGVYALDCPSTTFCIAADSLDRIDYFDGSGWSAGPDLGLTGEYHVESLSCATETLCVAVTPNEAVIGRG
jgi:hypothetical protein